MSVFLTDRGDSVGGSFPFCKATIRNADNVVVETDINVPHIADGEYFLDDRQMPNTRSIRIFYDFYFDAGFTQEANDIYRSTSQCFDLDEGATGGTTTIIEKGLPESAKVNFQPEQQASVKVVEVGKHLALVSGDDFVAKLSDNPTYCAKVTSSCYSAKVKDMGEC